MKKLGLILTVLATAHLALAEAGGEAATSTPAQNAFGSSPAAKTIDFSAAVLNWGQGAREALAAELDDYNHSGTYVGQAALTTGELLIAWKLAPRFRNLVTRTGEKLRDGYQRKVDKHTKEIARLKEGHRALVRAENTLSREFLVMKNSGEVGETLGRKKLQVDIARKARLDSKERTQKLITQERRKLEKFQKRANGKGIRARFTTRSGKILVGSAKWLSRLGRTYIVLEVGARVYIIADFYEEKDPGVFPAAKVIGLAVDSVATATAYAIGNEEGVETYEAWFDEDPNEEEGIVDVVLDETAAAWNYGLSILEFLAEGAGTGSDYLFEELEANEED